MWAVCVKCHQWESLTAARPPTCSKCGETAFAPAGEPEKPKKSVLDLSLNDKRFLRSMRIEIWPRAVSAGD